MRGFSLIELILVLLIISVICALAVPMFRAAFIRAQFEQACSDLSGALNYARSEAILKRRESKVLINNEGRSFSLEGVNKVYYLPQGIKINSDKEAVCFYPDSRSTVFTVTLSGPKKTRTFSSQGGRGYVKIK